VAEDRVRILIVEDEQSLREGLVDLVSGDGHEVEAVGDGPAAVERGTGVTFDLVVLDLRLPGMDGLEVCRRLRLVRPELPVLMLTARGGEEATVTGFAAGADDYVCKPFAARELLARIRALGRRTGDARAEDEVIEVDGCRIDLARHQVDRESERVNLTPREVGILRWLYRHRRRAVSRAELLERVWGASAELQTRTVDMTVAKLRRKVEHDAASPRIVVTVTGVGYAWGPGHGGA
jgi:DNA-binding response OmpR family regulator